MSTLHSISIFIDSPLVLLVSYSYSPRIGPRTPIPKSVPCSRRPNTTTPASAESSQAKHHGEHGYPVHRYGPSLFFKTLFELTSAYGTVGLSLSRGPFSFSGTWCWGSKLCLIGVMGLGKLRGLPEKVDPSVVRKVMVREACEGGVGGADPNNVGSDSQRAGGVEIGLKGPLEIGNGAVCPFGEGGARGGCPEGAGLEGVGLDLDCVGDHGTVRDLEHGRTPDHGTVCVDRDGVIHRGGSRSRSVRERGRSDPDVSRTGAARGCPEGAGLEGVVLEEGRVGDSSGVRVDGDGVVVRSRGGSVRERGRPDSCVSEQGRHSGDRGQL